MTINMQMRVKAFIRTIANYCDGCHNNGERCNTCVARTAKYFLKEMAADEVQPVIDNSSYSRVKNIKNELAKAGKPLLAKEINLYQTCSAQLKYWTLNQMVKKQMIGRKFAFKSKSKKKKKVIFFYFLKNKETK